MIEFLVLSGGFINLTNTQHTKLLNPLHILRTYTTERKRKIRKQINVFFFYSYKILNEKLSNVFLIQFTTLDYNVLLNRQQWTTTCLC